MRTEHNNRDKKQYPLNIDSILPLVRKPGRYIGGELNAVSGDPDADLSFALIFPDLYEIGMSHQGLQILYHIINNQPGLVAERCYAPDVDMEAQLRKQQLPLFSLESRRPLADFDLLGFTLPYELCYTNILTILDLAGIPLRSADRNDNDPLVIAGGSCSLNPEPVADFFDVVVLGDGEEVILEIADILRTPEAKELERRDRLRLLSRIAGIYIPVFFKPQYSGSQLTGIQPLLDDYLTVTRRVLPELPPAELYSKPLVPLVKPVHDRLGVEIARGCTRGCRFCQAGMIYRPVRERTVRDIVEFAEQGIENSGFDELALLSLSSGDFSCLPDLLVRLMDRFADEHVSVALPSMRVGTLTPEVIRQIRRVRKTGFTVAPEAGTDRLREVINKGITEQDLMQGCHDAFAAGWNLIKFYFMIGLPTETMEDVDGIIDLAVRAKKEAQGRKAQINVAIASFVPKPHTPFQWAGQLTLEESRERINYLKKNLPRKGFKLKWHDPYQSFLEGVFSRGDRRLSRLIEAAWQSGARLDGWSEHFSLNRWQQAAEGLDIDLDSYLRSREISEVLPWDHLSSGVERSFLEQEYEKSLVREYTPDCRNHSCQQCGLCDFKTIRPLVNKVQSEDPVRQGVVADDRPVQAANDRPVGSQQTAFSYRVHYSRLGAARFLGHLEVLQLVFRVLHRLGLPLLFSQGYNPSPKVSFSPALPVGVESHIEFFDMDLARPLKRPADMVAAFNEQFPDTITVTGVELIRKTAPTSKIISYEFHLPADVNPDEVEQRISRFLAAEQFIVERIRKRKRRELDLRPLVHRLEQDGLKLAVELVHPNGAAGTNPREVLEKILGLSGDQPLLARIVKLSSRELAANS
jgi:radical SAM family uncharacterized protein/radical SAM-linked protein